MGLETGTRVSDLVSTNPVTSDLRSQGDDHLRLIKAVLKATLQRLPGAETESEVTIVSGSITPDRGVHSVDTEADAATDDLANITATNFQAGALLLLHQDNGARVITVTDSGGNIFLPSGNNFAFPDIRHFALFKYDGSQWQLLGLVLDRLLVAGATESKGPLIGRSTLQIDGASTLTGAATLASTLGVTGLTSLVNALLSGTLGVTGLTTLAEAVITGTPVIGTGSGSEGGQVNLVKPASGTTLSGDVAVDVFGDTVRIFDLAGTNKGVTIDLASAGASAASIVHHSGLAVGAVGTYAFLGNIAPSNYNTGDTAAGSALRYTHAIGSDNIMLFASSPSGTWRCMGYMNGTKDQGTLWLRIS